MARDNSLRDDGTASQQQQNAAANANAANVSLTTSSASSGASASVWFGHQTDTLWQQEAFNELLLLLSARTHTRKQRKQIHARIADLLGDCTSAELDALLLSSDLRIFIKLSTMRTMDVVRLRMSELSIRCKARLLQEFNLARRYKNVIHYQFWAQFVREVFHSTKGLDLTILKNAIDSNGSWKNLFNLVYEDFNIIGGKDLRDEILQHIKREAAQVRRASTASAFGAPEEEGKSAPPQAPPGKPRIKIISDLDDTVWCSGGKFPAGCDKLYPAHSFYPGIFALYKEVTLGAESALTKLNAFPSPSDALSPSASSAGRASAIHSDRSTGEEVLKRYSTALSPSSGPPAAMAATAANPPRVLCSTVIREHSKVSMECEASETIARAWKRLAGKAGRPVYDMTVSIDSGDQSKTAQMAHLQDHSLVMLSARPSVSAAKGFFESMMYRKFIKLKEKGYFSTMPTLLPGSLIAGTKAMILGMARNVATCFKLDNRIVWKEVAHKKYRDMIKYMELYPEYDFLFFGDDGQGDVQVAINALKNPKLAVMGPGPRLSDVFIHQVMKQDAGAKQADIQSPKANGIQVSLVKPLRTLSPKRVV